MEQERNKSPVKARIVSEMERRIMEWIPSLIHDLRNPLQQIQASIELYRSQLRQIASPLYNVMMQSISHMNELISKTLIIFQNICENSELPFQPKYEEIDINNFLEEFWMKNLSLAEKNTGVDYSIFVQSTLPHYVQLPKVELSQVIQNLFSNSTKFTKQGSIKLVVSFLEVQNDLKKNQVVKNNEITEVQLSKIAVEMKQDEDSSQFGSQVSRINSQSQICKQNVQKSNEMIPKSLKDIGWSGSNFVPRENVNEIRQILDYSSEQDEQNILKTKLESITYQFNKMKYQKPEQYSESDECADTEEIIENQQNDVQEYHNIPNMSQTLLKEQKSTGFSDFYTSIQKNINEPTSPNNVMFNKSCEYNNIPATTSQSLHNSTPTTFKVHTFSEIQNSRSNFPTLKLNGQESLQSSQSFNSNSIIFHTPQLNQKASLQKPNDQSDGSSTTKNNPTSKSHVFDNSSQKQQSFHSPQMKINCSNQDPRQTQQYEEAMLPLPRGILNNYLPINVINNSNQSPLQTNNSSVPQTPRDSEFCMIFSKRKSQIHPSIRDLVFNRNNIRNFETRKVAKIQGFLKFEVLDTGSGMDEKEKNKIFKMFSQANSLVKEQYGGTGIGLYSAKQIASLLKGNIVCHSLKGIGSAFIFYLPCQAIFQTAESNETKEDKEIKPPKLNQMKEKIMETKENKEKDRFVVKDIVTRPIKNLPTTESLQRKNLQGINILQINQGLKIADSINFKLNAKNTILQENSSFNAFPKQNLGKDESLTEQDRVIFQLQDRKKKLRILYVDDSEFLLKAMEQLLSRVTCIEIKTYNNPERALEAIRNSKTASFDIIIIDQEMPEMSGRQLAQEIKKIDKKVSLVCYSGYCSAQKFEEESFAAGFTHCLPKPSTFEQILQLIYQISSKQTNYNQIA